MRAFNSVILGAAMLLAAACGRDNDQAATDSALSRDLSLANQVSPYPPMDSLSAIEGLRGTAGSGTAVAPRAPSGTTVRRATTTRRTASSGARTTTSSGGSVTTSSGGQVVVKKNTKRDAAIGAAAGAVIGATTSRNRVKGAVIGGVIGGVLGGVIGNNVDVQKTKKP